MSKKVPFGYVQPRKTHLNHHTLRLLKYWTWQFVIIRPICSILMITLQIVGMYPSWLSWTFTVILNLSFSLAMYSLVVFYHVFAKELEPHKPLAKFICIKGIVFFCFWQVRDRLSHLMHLNLFVYLEFRFRYERVSKFTCSHVLTIC